MRVNWIFMFYLTQISQIFKGAVVYFSYCLNNFVHVPWFQLHFAYRNALQLGEWLALLFYLSKLPISVAFFVIVLGVYYWFRLLNTMSNYWFEKKIETDVQLHAPSKFLFGRFALNFLWVLSWPMETNHIAMFLVML